MELLSCSNFLLFHIAGGAHSIMLNGTSPRDDERV